MADYEPSWSAIANKWADTLRQIAEIGTVYYPYPENAVDNLELPAVIINEPQDIEMQPFSAGAFTVLYRGELSLLIKYVDIGQARLYAGDISEITSFGLGLMIAVYRNRHIPNYATNISLGLGKIARFSPFDEDNRGHYAGLTMPYTIQMQYRSSL